MVLVAVVVAAVAGEVGNVVVVLVLVAVCVVTVRVVSDLNMSLGETVAGVATYLVLEKEWNRSSH